MGLEEYKKRKLPKVENLKDNPLYIEDEKELAKFGKIIRIKKTRQERLDKKTELKKIPFFKHPRLFYIIKYLCQSKLR